MRLYLLDHLTRHGIAPKEFFRSAYIWRFKKVIAIESLTKDVDGYIRGEDPPPYVQAYVRFIQSGKEEVT